MAYGTWLTGQEGEAISGVVVNWRMKKGMIIVINAIKPARGAVTICLSLITFISSFLVEDSVNAISAKKKGIVLA